MPKNNFQKKSEQVESDGHMKPNSQNSKGVSYFKGRHKKFHHPYADNYWRGANSHSTGRHRDEFSYGDRECDQPYLRRFSLKEGPIQSPIIFETVTLLT